MKARGIFGVITGTLLLASSAAHAFLGWPAIETALGAVGLDGETTGALAVGWYFGSVSMLVFGLVVAASAVEVLRRRQVARVPLVIIAAGYFGFGLTAWLARDLNPHFLLFVLTGLTIGVFAFWRS